MRRVNNNRYGDCSTDREMSSGFSANQYDAAFKSCRLQNWCENKPFKERPTAHVGHTRFIANDRGHLLPGTVKRGSAWPDFKGTWDLPARLPARGINPTARSAEGLGRLQSWGFYPHHTGSTRPHRGSRSTDRLQDAGKQLPTFVQINQTDEARPASQNRPVSGSETAAGQNQDSLAATARSADGPPSLGSAAEGKSASAEGRPASDASQAAASTSKQTHGDVQQEQ
ncbi:protein Flattop isoform X1 [Embiotoca jacksoni]|uniref:protein Flattop isoform X1 n=1 Tax=Embiotoca jacksoni TaxID=100190 RepID=UPI0037048B32